MMLILPLHDHYLHKLSIFLEILFCIPSPMLLKRKSIMLPCHKNQSFMLALQGCLICLALAFGWALAAYVRYSLMISKFTSLSWSHQWEIYSSFSSPHRNREIKQMKDAMKNGNSFPFLYHDINELEHSNQVNLPRVSVVMPLKGFGEHNLHNWRSQVRTYRTHATGTYLRMLNFLNYIFFWFSVCYDLEIQNLI